MCRKVIERFVKVKHFQKAMDWWSFQKVFLKIARNHLPRMYHERFPDINFPERHQTKISQNCPKNGPRNVLKFSVINQSGERSRAQSALRISQGDSNCYIVNLYRATFLHYIIQMLSWTWPAHPATNPRDMGEHFSITINQSFAQVFPKIPGSPGCWATIHHSVYLCIPPLSWHPALSGLQTICIGHSCIYM